MRRPRTRYAVAAAGLLVALLAVLQVALPRLAAGRAEDRLTADGGSADVSISAWPAVRLLLGGDGDRLEVRARGIAVDLAAEDRPLDRLDGFGEVDVRLEDSAAGPVEAELIEIERDGDAPYRFRLAASVVPRELARLAGSQLGGPLGGFFGGLAGGALPLADEPLPVELDVEVASDGGRPRVVSGGGSVAGIPLGPLAELLIRAVADRI